MDVRALGLAAIGGLALFLFGRQAQAATAPAEAFPVAPGWEPPALPGVDWGAPEAVPEYPFPAWEPPAPSAWEWEGVVSPTESQAPTWEPVYSGGEWNALPAPTWEPVYTGGEWDLLPEPAYPAPGVESYPAGSLTISSAGLDFLKGQEGFSAVPYWDVKGYSIGYGHFMGPVATMDYLTPEQGEQLLLADLEQYQTAVRENVAVPLTQGQYDALVDFTYNLGVGAFLQSTLLRLLNAGDYAGAANEFGKWINAGGAPNSALIARRAAEVQMFTA